MKQCVCTMTFAVLVNGRPQGGMDSSAMGLQTGVSARAPLIHTGGRYFGHLHGVAMYLWISCGIPDHGPSGRHSIATVRRRHHVLLAWVDGRCAPRIHYAGHILGLLGTAAKQGEVLDSRYWIVFGGVRPRICSTGHTRRLVPPSIPWASSGGGQLRACNWQLVMTKIEARLGG